MVVVAVFCFVAVYDFCSPWPTASQSLEHFGRHYQFCIGMGLESSTTITNDRTTVETSKQRVFILMRAPISWPRFVAVSQDQDGRVRIDESIFRFWFWLLLTGAVVFGAWRLGVRPLLGTKRQPANTP